MRFDWHEAAAHPAYRARIVEANARDTLHTTLFDIGWPDAPHRVLRTKGVERWEAAGRPLPGQRPGEGVTLAHSRRADVEIPLVNFGEHIKSASSGPSHYWQAHAVCPKAPSLNR